MKDSHQFFLQPELRNCVKVTAPSTNLLALHSDITDRSTCNKAYVHHSMILNFRFGFLYVWIMTKLSSPDVITFHQCVNFFLHALLNLCMFSMLQQNGREFQ